MSDLARRDAERQERILDHYRRPRRRGPLPDATGSATARSARPDCPDAITMTVRVDDGVVSAARFAGDGCSVARATASMLAELAEGRTVADLAALRARFDAMLAGDPAAADDPALGELRALAGIARAPFRIPCATLPWDALAGALPAHG